MQFLIFCHLARPAVWNLTRMNRATCFTCIPQDDLSDIDPAYVWVDEPDCCYTPALTFLIECMGDADEAQEVWEVLTPRDRQHYENLELADRVRAAGAKRTLLLALCNADDRWAWTTCFDEDLVIGCAPSMQLFYLYACSSSLAWVHTCAREVVMRLFSGPRYRAAQTGCNCRECRDAGLAPHWSLEEAEQMVYALLLRAQLVVH